MPGPQSADLLRRVRAWNVSAWRHADRIAQTRSALQRLADLAGAHDGLSRPAVPDAGVHALADQLHVLVDDALGSGAPAGEVEDILADLATALGGAQNRSRGHSGR